MTPPFRLIKFRPPPTEPPRSTPYLNATSETFLKKVGSLSQRSPLYDRGPGTDRRQPPRSASNGGA
jgi:hypothetical protein